MLHGKSTMAAAFSVVAMCIGLSIPSEASAIFSTDLTLEVVTAASC